MGVKTEVISLGDYRRKTLGGAQKLPPDYFTLGKTGIYSIPVPNTTSLRLQVRRVQKL